MSEAYASGGRCRSVGCRLGDPYAHRAGLCSVIDIDGELELTGSHIDLLLRFGIPDADDPGRNPESHARSHPGRAAIRQSPRHRPRTAATTSSGPKSSISTSDEYLTPSARAFTPRLTPSWAKSAGTSESASPTTITPQLKARLNFNQSPPSLRAFPYAKSTVRSPRSMGPSSSCHSPPYPSRAFAGVCLALWSCDTVSV